MERPSFQDQFLWSFLLIQLVIFMAEANVTTVLPQVLSDPAGGRHSWSAWSAWSPCSKTCGGGVAIQERQCLPRKRIDNPDITLPPPLITVRVTREVGEDCPGEARRYHECNTAPCPGGVIDSRAEQCAVYDRRPFRGRFFTWVPYIDGDSPCTLNCRPLGQHFYASLALVPDGTPCTRPGYRAICVQGVCKVVGREGVLAVAASREARCGRRLVSGLFSRPRLPLGYSHVATVPRGACRLNVSEILPTENYIALKVTNGSYIMNGEFAVSSSGTYEAAGTRFLYSRTENIDTIFALGPIQYPIDIMILYTQPNPSIKYEYLTESLPGDIDNEPVTKSNIPDIFSTAQTKHFRRHHSYETFSRPAPRYLGDVSISKEKSNDNLEENYIGGRRFVWKITSYTPCSRSCGGGIQMGKYRCVELFSSGTDREVSPVHCLGSPPAVQRRRCGNVPCPPRWRAAAWSACPQCGPATRTRIVGCVQDHSKGIVKISDQKCPTLKPSTTESCNIPDCNDPGLNEVKYIGPKRANRPEEETENFRGGPVYTVAVNSTDLDVGPEYSFSAAAGWLFTEWSNCVGWCIGGGLQTREVRCTDPSGCGPRKVPESSRTCTSKLSCESHEGQWFTGDWSPCSSSCKGKQVRGVLCIGGTGRHLRDSACKGVRPNPERNCGEDCPSTWYYSDWSPCTGNCTLRTGLQRRTVWCAKDNGVSDDTKCTGAKPLLTRICSPECTRVSSSTIPPDLTIESQKSWVYDLTTITTTTTSTVRTTNREIEPEDCADRLSNCVLAVQARLCHYKYYVHNCCFSCRGR